MSEQRIRRVLRQVLDDLDRRARQAALASAVGLGVGLASGCAKGEPSEPPPPVDRTVPDAGTTAKELVPPPLPPYGAVLPPSQDRASPPVETPDAAAPGPERAPKGR